MTARTISGASRLYGVVGDPVQHSLSPFIHNRWLAEAGIDAAYVPVHLKSGDAAADLRALARAGFSGLNVTLPHKIAALEAADAATDVARLVGAANTLILREDRTWAADNTDVQGFAFALQLAAPGVELRGRRVVLIGAGGAARAALAHLNAAGAAITLVNRSTDKAAEAAAQLAPGARISGLAGLREASEHADVVVNSASLGHSGARLPELSAGRGRPFLDMSYGKAASAQLADAQAAGWAPHDGLAMLVGQAAAAFRLWHGWDPDAKIALDACRARTHA